MDSLEIASSQRLLLPTGDGICIALTHSDLAYDIHLRLALEILEKLERHNSSTDDETRRFQLRIGLNQNVDNLITDVNGQPNVAGSGINVAQRVMDYCDPNQILLGQTVYDILRVREAYQKHFQRYVATTKYGTRLLISQFTRTDAPGLNSNPPSLLVPKGKKVPALTKLVAYYIALSVKHQEFLMSCRRDTGFDYLAVIWLYFQADDLDAVSNLGKFETLTPRLWGSGGANIIEQYEHYRSQDFWMRIELSDRIKRTELRDYGECFDSYTSVFASQVGIKRLRVEHPAIATEILGDDSHAAA